MPLVKKNNDKDCMCKNKKRKNSAQKKMAFLQLNCYIHDGPIHLYGKKILYEIIRVTQTKFQLT